MKAVIPPERPQSTGLEWSLRVALGATFLLLAGCAHQPPAHWFAPVEPASAASWEVLPQEAAPGEVILSKRTELGLLSNFAATPFVLRGKLYASVEGFWQMMLYPEPKVDGRPDPRMDKRVSWPHTRAEVAGMTAFEAKKAGEIAQENLKKLGLEWVSFEGRSLPYFVPEQGAHYTLIVEAMRAKMDQNPAVKAVLKATGQLRLRPDHKVPAGLPPAWRYQEIWEKIRAEIP